ncbi:Modification methylase AplI [Aquicella siphonis]|uniref:Cytosine-specific methyltransferase n=1 Tax=Aquicella siphonis TaxID=254247 RepID=A0A5E4PEJ9_9COXI|nr:DNA (cytosine-5-)-methyltransferase [Aquicella siphonis]VVC75002.1 Modification methylase AplI [Aquicella siphonis]
MKSVEIFSGAGGLAKGLEIAGINHVAFVENNKNACATLKANFKSRNIFCGDIEDYEYCNLPTIDIVAGGPPCQPFSLGGKHKANQDNRDMFPYAIKAIETLTPKAFFFENVKGLLRPSFSDYFKYIILRLTYPECQSNSKDWRKHLLILNNINFSSYTGIKYKVTYKLLNAADYGVPQCRERVVIIGLRSDLNVDWTFPTQTHSEKMLLWNMCISGEYWEKYKIPKSKRNHPLIVSKDTKDKVIKLKNQFDMFSPQLRPWRTVRDALSDIPDPRSFHNIRDHIFRDGAKIYPGHSGSYYDWPSKTIKAGDHGVPGGENMIRYHDDTVRYFTIFEAKRIQTFPDNFYIHGSWGEAMRQIGNAVPVALAEVIGMKITEILSEKNKFFKRKGDKNTATFKDKLKKQCAELL